MSKIKIEVSYSEFFDVLIAMRYHNPIITWDFEKRFEDALDAWKQIPEKDNV